MSRYLSFYNYLQDKIRNATNEEELRAGFAVAAETHLGITDLHLERGRQDLRRNRIIVEFKSPGLFRNRDSNPNLLRAQSQLATNYILDQAAADGRDCSDYTGVCFDGYSIAYVSFDESGLVGITKLESWNENSAAHLVHVLLNDERIELVPENVERDFGPGSPIAGETLRVLLANLEESIRHGENRTAMLYTEWTDIFLQCSAMNAVNQERLSQDLESCGLPANADPTQVLFTLHTYHALVFKLIAAEVALANTLLGDAPQSYCPSAIAMDNETLIHSLETSIEGSQLFRQSNLLNFIEGVFFSWYLDNPSPAIVSSIRSILSQIALYRLRNLRLEKTRDVIKRIYQQLVPSSLRHDLGEYFTPEWLVEFTLNKIGYSGPDILDQKFLDPCCGSGTFLIHAIDRYKQEARRAGWDTSQILTGITSHIFGFDLNPLAVLSTRINYLIAISDLIASHSDVEIPCYQSDAIYSPSSENDGAGTRTYRITTRQESITLDLPESLVQDRTLVGRVFEKMEDAIAQRQPYNIFMSILQGEGAYRSHPESQTWRAQLESLYTQLEHLENISWDRIWCRLIRNFFASVAIGQCKFIGSNPPWIKWANLPAGYKEKVAPTCQEYGIFSQDRYFGGNELDISAVITYSVANKWLQHGGGLGFILTQSHFQSQSSGGFRQFEVLGTPLQVQSVDDFSKVQPFQDVANKPTVIALSKGKATNYPVRYTAWEKNESGDIEESTPLSDVMPQLRQQLREATPMNGPGGRWCILRPGRFQALARLDGSDSFRCGRKGITTDLNGAFFVEPLGPGRNQGVIRCKSTPALGKKPVPEVMAEIEHRLLFPLIKGARDVRRFYATVSNLLAIIPNTKINCSEIPLASAFAEEYPQAYQYFQRIDNGPAGALLNERATWKRSMQKTYAKWTERNKISPHDIPVYAIDNIGDYTFSSYKVVWAELSHTIMAAVIGSYDLPFGLGKKPIVPDHKIYFSPFEIEAEAHYVCALINSEPISEFIDGFTVKLQVGSLFKHFHLPPFNPDISEHRTLAELSAECHQEAIANGGPISRPAHLEEINRLAYEII